MQTLRFVDHRKPYPTDWNMVRLKRALAGASFIAPEEDIRKAWKLYSEVEFGSSWKDLESWSDDRLVELMMPYLVPVDAPTIASFA